MERNRDHLLPLYLETRRDQLDPKTLDFEYVELVLVKNIHGDIFVCFPFFSLSNSSFYSFGNVERSVILFKLIAVSSLYCLTRKQLCYIRNISSVMTYDICLFYPNRIVRFGRIYFLGKINKFPKTFLCFCYQMHCNTIYSVISSTNRFCEISGNYSFLSIKECEKKIREYLEEYLHHPVATHVDELKGFIRIKGADRAVVEQCLYDFGF